MVIAVKTGKYIQCEYCGKTVYKTLSQYNKREHHFCSNKCQSLQKHLEAYHDVPCEECGKLMHISKKSTQRFCSDECQHSWQRKQVGELNPRYDHIPFICDNCGKEFLNNRYREYASVHHFCSVQCRRDWYRSVWSQRPEWREESSLRAAKLLSKNPNTKTKPQVIINKILENMNIKYKNEYVFKYYSVDNYLLDHNLIIEVMGDYWHCNRIKYPVIQYEIQKSAIRRDKAKHSYMKKYHNIEILYLWESDILNRTDVVEMIIDEYIKNHGELPNYHSLNYVVADDTLVLSDMCIKTYQDMDADELKEYYKSAS